MTAAQTMFAHLDQFQRLNLSLRSVCVLYYLAGGPSQPTISDIALAVGVRINNGNLRTSLIQMVEQGLITRTTTIHRNLPLHHHCLSTAGYKLLRLPKPTDNSKQ
jgi:hypothetical protein